MAAMMKKKRIGVVSSYLVFYFKRFDNRSIVNINIKWVPILLSLVRCLSETKYKYKYKQHNHNDVQLSDLDAYLYSCGPCVRSFHFSTFPPLSIEVPFRNGRSISFPILINQLTHLKHTNTHWRTHEERERERHAR